MEYVCRVGTPTGEVVEQTFTASDESALRADLFFGGEQRPGQFIEFVGHTCVRHDRSPCVQDKKRSWPGANSVPQLCILQ